MTAGRLLEWIPVKEKLPEKDGPVLFYAPSADPEMPFIWTAWYNPKSGWSMMTPYWTEGITHWMYLPEPPQGSS